MSAFPSSSIGLPRSLNYEMPPSASDSCRSYSVNLSPDGITSVQAPTQNFFIANQATQGQFNSQVVSFSIPSGNSNSVFLDPTHTTLSFSLTYNISTGSTTTNPQSTLISSAASFFDQLVLYSNNTPLEQVNQYGLLQNFLLQNTVNLSQRYGGMTVGMGCDSNSANGIDLPHAAVGTYRFNFCIPLLSMIGINSERLFPIGCVSNLQLQMTTSQILPIVSYCTSVAAQPVFSQNFLLSEFSLNLKYIDIGEMASSMLMATLPDNRILYKSATYTNSQITIPNGSSGAQQLLLQIRNTSVKSIYSQFGQSNSVAAQSLVSPNGYYDGINISTNSRQLQVGGSFYPNRPINDVSRPSEGYLYLIQALGGSIPSSLGTVVNREMYNSVGGTTLPTGTNVETFLVLPATTVRAASAGNDGGSVSVLKYPNSHFHGYDLERLGGVMFSGINTRSTPPFLNLNIQNALTSTITCNAWGYSDVVLVFDIGSKSVQAFV
ncbi:MAG: hypothetical protein RLZZ354_522 [Pseudomonadota bacterium]|jgi:hypothetical protein